MKHLPLALAHTLGTQSPGRPFACNPACTGTADKAFASPLQELAPGFVLAGILAMISTAPLAHGQLAPIPLHEQPCRLNSGVHNGMGNAHRLAFRQIIQATGAPWLRLHFGDSLLGTGSFIAVKALLDGDEQRLDARSLAEWKNSSGAFKGDAVELSLYVAPDDQAAHICVDRLIIGDWAGTPSPLPPLQKTLCGPDDRVASNDPAVGRIISPLGPALVQVCTGWITTGGFLLTAGHCASNGAYIEFNVPPSMPNGTIVPAALRDQYPITSFVYINDNPGNDWAVFACAPNANTKLLPARAQADFYRLSIADPPANVRVTGYGADSTPPGTTGAGNAQNATEQTDIDVYLGQTAPPRATLQYTVDTEGGNSGSPISGQNPLVAYGIHDAGACNPPGVGNVGTGFRNPVLAQTVQSFQSGGAEVRYVDAGSSFNPSAHSIFTPDLTVTGALPNPSAGMVLRIVTGSYNETMRIRNSMRIEAPVGRVIIGK